MVAYVSQGAFVQTATAIDTVGQTYANALFCGARTFTISPTTYAFLTLASGVLTLQSNIPAEATAVPMTITITAGLVSYPSVVATQTFTIKIICKVTALSWSPALPTTYSHTLKIDPVKKLPFAVT